MAFRDPVTDLPTQALFQDRLEQALSLAQRKRTKIALLHLDIDTGGAAATPELLRAIAERIGSELRGSDSITRTASDDFTVLLNDVDGRRAAQAVAEEVLIALKRPVGADGVRLEVAYTLALYPDDAADAAALLRAVVSD